MSTRAVYTFIDDEDVFHVYKQSNGYPEGAYNHIKNAIEFAEKLPGFEAAEFGAAFIAANKRNAGGVYLTKGFEYHGDLFYRYEIFERNGVISLNGFKQANEDNSWDLIFEGSLKDFKNYKETERPQAI